MMKFFTSWYINQNACATNRSTAADHAAVLGSLTPGENYRALMQRVANSEVLAMKKLATV
jgi:hypothetical protein